MVQTLFLPNDEKWFVTNQSVWSDKFFDVYYMSVGQKLTVFENSAHNSHTHDPRQPRGCSWGGYATQGDDQGLKLKVGILSVW